MDASMIVGRLCGLIGRIGSCSRETPEEKERKQRGVNREYLESMRRILSDFSPMDYLKLCHYYNVGQPPAYGSEPPSCEDYLDYITGMGVGGNLKPKLSIEQIYYFKEKVR